MTTQILCSDYKVKIFCLVQTVFFWKSSSDIPFQNEVNLSMPADKLEFFTLDKT
jgi:hypothetical protein